jgi:hypothetical protein
MHDGCDYGAHDRAHLALRISSTISFLALPLPRRWPAAISVQSQMLILCLPMQARTTSSIGFSHHSFEKISISQ